MINDFLASLPHEANVTINCQLADLRNLVQDIVDEITEKEPAPTPTVEYLTTEEVCKRFRIDRVTLWRWNRDKWLVPIKGKGKKNLYRLEDVEKFDNSTINK